MVPSAAKGAELVEPTERTEGNTREQHTRWTLRRVSVSERLDRVRGAAHETLLNPKLNRQFFDHRIPLFLSSPSMLVVFFTGYDPDVVTFSGMRAKLALCRLVIAR